MITALLLASTLTSTLIIGHLDPPLLKHRPSGPTRYWSSSARGRGLLIRAYWRADTIVYTRLSDALQTPHDRLVLCWPWETLPVRIALRDSDSLRARWPTLGIIDQRSAAHTLGLDVPVLDAIFKTELYQ